MRPRPFYEGIPSLGELCLGACESSAAALHPSTSPAAIAADQRAAVAESLVRLGAGASDEAVSLDAVLPASVVVRRRAELRRRRVV